jgi:hypothetical protein
VLRRWVLVLVLAGCGHEVTEAAAPPAATAATPPPAPLPEPANLDEACARWKCRPDTKVRLEVPEGNAEIPVGRSPYSDGTLVRILAGERLVITGDVQGDQLVNLRVVDVPAARDVLLLTLEQKKIGEKPSMVLKVENRFARNVKYRAGMEVLRRKGFASTSSCAVMAGKMGFEMWPHPIVSVLMKDFRFSAPGANVPCN